MPYVLPTNEAPSVGEGPYLGGLTQVRRYNPVDAGEPLSWRIVCKAGVGASLPAPWVISVTESGGTCIWVDESEALTVVSSPQLGLIKQLYSLRHPEMVSAFLTEHPYLVSLLMDAYFQIVKYFGDEPDIVLEVVTDKDVDNCKELFVFVQTTLVPQEAITRLSRLDQGWWIEESHRAQGNLCIHVEFG